MLLSGAFVELEYSARRRVILQICNSAETARFVFFWFSTQGQGRGS